MKKMSIQKEIEENEKIVGKSQMYVVIVAGFLGLVMTLFILILTIKIELIDSELISYQLVLSIPFFMLQLISQAKMVDISTIKQYYVFNRIVSGISFAFLYNSLGLLISKYVSSSLGVLFFMIYMMGICFFMHNDLKTKDIRKIYRDSIIMVLVLLLGLLPALGIIQF